MLVGFAGGGADALALFARLEAKLEEFGGNLERAVVELAKDWRTDRALRQLQALIIVTDREKSFLSDGAGDLMQPDDEDGVLAIGSGGQLRRSPRRAPCCATPSCRRAEIVEEAMTIAAEICVFTNDRLTIEELDPRWRSRSPSEAGLQPVLENMTPRQIVAELDKYVVGQRQAKRAVAIALRNRWRRQQLPAERRRGDRCPRTS